MVNALYGARFKSWIGGQGLVSAAHDVRPGIEAKTFVPQAENITWSNMRFSNVSYPLYVTSKYFNQGSAQTQIQVREGCLRNDRT
jgi:hypothetical protein